MGEGTGKGGNIGNAKGELDLRKSYVGDIGV